MGRMVSKRKEPKAPRTTLSDAISTRSQHTNTTNTTERFIKVRSVRSRQHRGNTHSGAVDICGAISSFNSFKLDPLNLVFKVLNRKEPHGVADRDCCGGQITSCCDPLLC
jgi:hypothetical protein